MKKIRRVFALVSILGLGLGAAACTSPVAPSSEYDLGSQSYDLGSQSYDLGSQSYDLGSQSYDLGSQS